MSAVPRPYYTEEAYLELERNASYRSEYYRGEIFAMAGASEEHNTIAVNLSDALAPQLKGRPCRRYLFDMRLNIPKTGLYTYPDMMIVCGERKFTEAQPDTLTNPQIIIEILSDSTEAYDRGEKFRQYEQIPSLQEYILIAQDKVSVEQFVRDGTNKWTFYRYNNLEDGLPLPTIQCEIVVADIYAQIDLDEV